MNVNRYTTTTTTTTGQAGVVSSCARAKRRRPARPVCRAVLFYDRIVLGGTGKLSGLPVGAQSARGTPTGKQVCPCHPHQPGHLNMANITLPDGSVRQIADG